MNDYNNNQNPNGTGGNPPQYGNAYKTTASNAGGWQPPQGQASSWQPPQAPNYGGSYTGAPNTPQQPEADYKWSFDEYDNAAGAKKPKKKNKGVVVFASIVCSMLAVAVIGFAGYGVYNIVSGNDVLSPIGSGAETPLLPITPELNISNVPSGTEPAPLASGVLSTKQIAEKVQPSVVGIVSYLPNTQANNMYGFPGGGAIQASEGSGIIMSSDGYIITNHHVVADSTGMKVVLNNNEEYEAKMVGVDAATDLAVIKIDAKNLTPAEFGDSNALVVGEDVVAIGNPGGLEFANSLTKGVVSGINRPIKSSSDITSYTMNCIQTDAAINPGNSGGALVNEFGQVVGINSSKITGEGYEGLGFAIPISEAKPIVDDLIANGRVTGRVKLGVTGAQIDEIAARFNNVPVGFQVYQTDEGSDIAAKGVIPGDIITKIDGKDIASRDIIVDHLRSFKPGDKVTLTVFRRTSGRQDSTFEVTIAVMEDVGASQAEITPQSAESDKFSFFG